MRSWAELPQGWGLERCDVIFQDVGVKTISVPGVTFLDTLLVPYAQTSIVISFLITCRFEHESSPVQEPNENSSPLFPPPPPR